MATGTSSSESEAEGEIHLHGYLHGLEGYQFEPEGAYSESSDDGSDEGEAEGDSDPQAQPQESRVGNTAWCTCGHCAHISLSRAKEQLGRSGPSTGENLLWAQSTFFPFCPTTVLVNPCHDVGEKRERKVFLPVDVL